MVDRLSTIYSTLIGGVGLSLLFDWLVVGIISPFAAMVALAAGCVLTTLGVIMEVSNELWGKRK